MMEARFETAFLKTLKKHASIRKLVKNKVDMSLENPVSMGEPLKGNRQGFYSCPVKRNFIIIYLFCEVCRKKGDDAVILCESFELLLKFGNSSFLRKQESSSFKAFWIPAYAGMTKWGYFSKLSIQPWVISGEKRF